jgi:predicted nucleotidyltransferase
MVHKDLERVKHTTDIYLLRRIKELVREIVPDAQIILYGSRARGDAQADSDYDILILVDGPLNWRLERTIGDHLYDLELETGETLSIQVYSKDTWNSPIYRITPFRKNVEQEGIVL